jgi:hypothetical protein
MKPMTQRELAHAVFGHRSTPERNLTGRKTGYELRNAAGAVLQASDRLSVLTRWFEDKVDCVIVDCARNGAVVWPPERVSGIEST